MWSQLHAAGKLTADKNFYAHIRSDRTQTMAKLYTADLGVQSRAVDSFKHTHTHTQIDKSQKDVTNSPEWLQTLV